MTMRRAFTPIMGRTAFYFADGTGRDLYIANNNGGMTSAKPQGYIMGTRKLPLTNRRIRNTTNYTVTRLSYRAQVFVLSRRRGWERRVYNVRLCKSARANSGGLHAGRLPAESRQAFVSSLRAYPERASTTPWCYGRRMSKTFYRPRQDQPIKLTQAAKTTITFPGNVCGRRSLYEYQKRLDARLSAPKQRATNVKRY
eukprot:TRINITY_DN11313_c0_g1_i5.p1 TRINITY_DN11313_c0_g1~~TRINITY_DN11313_c0_g1_i5.p1  ORF type:complete len:198 (-),score=12.26 TRINITY_DN11313_c0_g1_i5:57-650(-)